MNYPRLPRTFLIILSLLVFSIIEMSDQPFEKKWNLDIVYIGNSITEGTQLGKPEEEAPPAAASDYLRRQTRVGNVQFLNQGRSGSTTLDYLPAGNGALKEVIDATRRFHKNRSRLLIFTISLGANDNAEKGTNGSSDDPVGYQNNLKLITDKLLSEFPECKVVLLQPIWYSPNTYNSTEYMSEGLALLQSYFSELQSLVLKYSKTKPGHIFLGDLKGFAYFRNNYLTDLIPEEGNASSFYLHPNKKGANVLGRLWGDAIYESLFKD